MAFAKGKYAYRISDRSGFRYRIRDMRKERKKGEEKREANRCEAKRAKKRREQK